MTSEPKRLEQYLPVQSSRLSIRLLTVSDAPELAAMTNDPRITGVVHFLPDDFTAAEAEKLIVGDGSGRDNYLGASLKETDELVALIGVHFHDNGETEIGYWVKADLHGRGIATEAVTAVMSTLNNAYPERPLVAECRTANTASWKLLEKLGFRGTGETGHRPGRMKLVLG